MQGLSRCIDGLRRLACGVALVLGASGIALAEEGPDQLVKRVAEDVLNALRQDPELKAGNQAKIAELIEQKVAPHFDFERMTRLAVGRSWNQATPEQRKALVEQFRALLVRSYSAAFSGYQSIVIEVKPLRMRPDETDVQVRSEFKLPGGAPPIAVDYGMVKTPSAWKVWDVIVQGASLVLTYRGTFAEIIKASGIDGLIKSLEEKNAPPPPGVKKK